MGTGAKQSGGEASTEEHYSNTNDISNKESDRQGHTLHFQTLLLASSQWRQTQHLQQDPLKQNAYPNKFVLECQKLNADFIFKIQDY